MTTFMIAPKHELRLHGKHVCTATCVVKGGSPMWVVEKPNGTFIRFYAYKKDVRDAYPKHSWTTVHGSWEYHTGTETFKRWKDKRDAVFAQTPTRHSQPVSSVHNL